MTIGCSNAIRTGITTTDYYAWKIDVTFNMSGGDTITRSLTGKVPVVVNGSGATYGQGWSVGGLDKLVSVSGGVMWVYGNGGARFFESEGSGVFLGPPSDFGTLTQSLSPFPKCLPLWRLNCVEELPPPCHPILVQAAEADQRSQREARNRR